MERETWRDGGGDRKRAARTKVSLCVWVHSFTFLNLMEGL